jgi:hypothetical protein
MAAPTVSTESAIASGASTAEIFRQIPLGRVGSGEEGRF